MEKRRMGNNLRDAELYRVRGTECIFRGEKYRDHTNREGERH